MKEIKHLFFTYRNGAVADSLRRYGIPHKVIFGLEIPRIAEIARGLTPSMELADCLWNDSDVRESRILATYLFPPEEISIEKALELAGETRSREEADMLAFRLFKRLPFSGELLKAMEGASTPELIRGAEALRPHLS